MLFPSSPREIHESVPRVNCPKMNAKQTFAHLDGFDVM